LVCALGVPGDAAAQGVRVSGRVVRVLDADSQPLTGAFVTLHQVTAQGGGPVDSSRSDARGRYVLGGGAADTTALYVVSVMHHGIAYFTRPVHLFGAAAGAAEVLAVFDTSSVEPAIATAQRHIVVRRPAGDGTRRVVELIVLANAGTRTRLAPDSARPVWQEALPRGAFQLEVGESDVSRDAVVLREGRLAVSAPIPPGEKQVVVSYLLPASVNQIDFVADQPVLRLNILVEDSAAAVAAGPLSSLGFEQMEEASFARFDGAVTAAGARITVTLGRSAFSPGSLWWVIVVAFGGALIAAFGVRFRRAAAPAEPTDPASLAAQLAVVSAALARAGALPDAERTAYERRRALLEQRLADQGTRPGA
jgi:hypothetical protein